MFVLPCCGGCGFLRWVETMEEIPSYLYPGLAQLQKRSGSEGKGEPHIVPHS